MLKRLLRQLIGHAQTQVESPSELAGVIGQALDLQAHARWTDAEQILRTGLRSRGRNADLLHLLATNLMAQGNNRDAIPHLLQVLDLQPGRVEAHFHLAQAQSALGDDILAEQGYARALALKPDFVEAMSNLANVQRSAGQVENAERWLRRALELKPDFAEAAYNLGRLLQAEGRIPEALQCHRRAFTANPSLGDAHTNYLYWLNFDPAYTPEEVFEAHTQWARIHAEPLMPRPLVFTNPRALDRTLRVGYVSPNFKDHAAAYFFVSTLEHHDLSRLHAICYSDTTQVDRFTERICKASAEWRETAQLSDAELADLVRQDRIDILVDLSGHTEGNRLLAFARKPAPLQVTWNGYANTTGMPAMDYRITDALADPPGLTEHLHTERLLRMPDVYMAFEPPDAAPEVNPLPALENGHVTFGSFNAITKLTPQVVQAWSRILRRLPAARLLLATVPSETSRIRILAMFARNGVDDRRIDVHGWLSRTDFLALHQRADIALDPFPFHGTTTTCHSLWMGLPVVTLAGQSHVSRVGVSMLSSVGLPELIALSEDQYIEAAVQLAQNQNALRQIRLTLRQRMAKSPLTDARRFAGHLEIAFQEIWTEWCRRHVSTL